MKMLSWLLLFLIWNSPAAAQVHFYEGKTITVISASSTGSAYDIYARLVAQFMGKHIPGNPGFVVQNMAGAGSLIGTNYVYGLAKSDGTVIGALQPSLYFNQLLKQPEAKYDWAKFNWLGSSDKSESLLYMRADLPYKSMADVRKAKEPPKCGSTGPGTSGTYMPRLLEELLGTKFTVISGYKGGAEIDLSVERGELQCRALTIQAYHTREPYHTWRRTGFARILMQTGNTRDPRIAETPTIYELMNEFKTTESQRRLLPLILAASDFGRPFVAPPAVPPARVKILRDAFLKTLSDPDLLAEAKRKDLDITPTPGEELQSLAKQVVVQTPEVVARLKTLME
ncbi:MAG TPA: tripartite tricarboxylate transporter substrate-binding protein [Candidatus Binatia bacterium]|nr:tripartite tricarboxylate transporter substrate-binding protein [Candidatus Binatia bacterium]